MTEKRYTTMWKPETTFSRFWIVRENWERKLNANDVVDLLNELHDENEQLKKELKRCRDWLNSDKNDYQLTLAFIKSKGYSLKDVLEYEKELKE